jgi:hypothetical protein
MSGAAPALAVVAPSGKSAAAAAPSTEAAFSPRRAAENSPMKESMRVEKARQVVRKRVAEELLSTEKTYVRSLADAAMRVVAMLKQGASGLSRDEYDALFLNYEEILRVHQRFLNNLTKRLADFTPATPIGDVLVSDMKFLDLYDRYMGDYSSSLALLQYLVPRRPTLRAVKEAFEKQNEQGTQLPLEAHLILPVQRAPRYLLLVKELVKYTPPTHDDYDALLQAQEYLQEKLAKINSEMATGDGGQSMGKILQLMNTLEGADQLNLIKSSRRFVKEGQLKLKVQKAHGTSGRSFRVFQKQYYFFLFNDMVLVASRREDAPATAKKDKDKDKDTDRESFELVEILQLNEVSEVGDGLPPTPAAGLAAAAVSADVNPYSTRGGTPELSFYLFTTAGATWTLIGNTPDEKDVWLEAFRRQVGATSPAAAAPTKA